MTANSLGQPEAVGADINEGVGGFGKGGRIVRCDDHRISIDDHPEPEGRDAFDEELFERPGTQPVRSGPHPETLILNLDVDRQARCRITLILYASFEVGDELPPGR